MVPMGCLEADAHRAPGGRYRVVITSWRRFVECRVHSACVDDLICKPELAGLLPCSKQ